MNFQDNIAVTSRSFSKNKVLRETISNHYMHIKFNDEGLKLENESLIHFLKDCDKAIVGLEKFNNQILSQLPKLKVISRFGVGLDGLDLDSLERHNVRLSCVPGVNRLAVAELTISFMLQLMRNSFNVSCQLKQGKWNKTSGYQLSGKTIGIIGANHIGKEVIRLLSPFQCRVLIYDIADLSKYCEKYFIEQVPFDYLVEQSDIVSLHVPANINTFHMINESVINKMKRTAFLINTSRGEIVDQLALKEALRSKKIAGAALDVFEHEPEHDLEFLSFENLISTPHLAGNTIESELAMGYAAILGLENSNMLLSA